MPALEFYDAYQYACYWPPMLDTEDRQMADPYGQVRVAVNVSPTVPLELRVRWEDVLKQILLPNGNTIKIDALVVVGQEVKVGGAMWKGRRADLPGTQFVPETDVMYVWGFNGTPDLKNRNQRRTAMLIRKSDHLPERG